MNAAYNRTLELRGGVRVVVLRTHADYLLAPKRAGYEPPRAARSTKLLSLRAQVDRTKQRDCVRGCDSLRHSPAFDFQRRQRVGIINNTLMNM